MMKRYKIEISDRFIEKLDSLDNYFENDDYKYFRYIYNEIFKKIDLLAEHPYMYPSYTKNLRKMVIPNIKYNVYYHVMDTEERILVIDLYAFKEEQMEKEKKVK